MRNALDDFRSWTTHHFLLIANNTDGLKRISETRDFSGLSRDNGSGGVLLAIDTTTDSDWTIRNVAYKTSTVTNFATGGHTPIGACTIQVEEYGSARFQYYLRMVTEKYLETGWFGLTFCLITRIIGHADDGSTKKIDLAPKYLMLTNIDTDLGQIGRTKYELSFYDQTQGAASLDPRFGKLNDGVCFASKTNIGSCLRTLEDELNAAMATLTGKWFEQTEPGYGRPVLYRISVPKDIAAMAVTAPSVEKETQAVRQKAPVAEGACPATEEKAKTGADAPKAEEKKEKAKVISEWDEYVKFVKTKGVDLNDQKAVDAATQKLTKINAQFLEEYAPDPCKPGKNKKGGSKIIGKIPSRPVERTLSADEVTAIVRKQATSVGHFYFPVNASVVSVIEEILKKSTELIDASGAYEKFKAELSNVDKLLRDKYADIDASDSSQSEKDAQKKQLKEQKQAEIVKSAASAGALFSWSIATRITSSTDSIKLHFDVTKKYLPSASSLGRQQVSSTSPTDFEPRLGHFVEFDYSFTGESKDIIDYQMAWKQGTAVIANDRFSSSSTTRSKDSAITSQAGKVSVATTSSPDGATPSNEASSTAAKTKAVAFRYDAIVPPPPTADTINKYSGGYRQADVTPRNVFMRMCQVFAASETVTSVKVRGNPALLNSSTPVIYPHDDALYNKRFHQECAAIDEYVKSFVNGPGWENYVAEYLPIFCKINVRGVSEEKVMSSSRAWADDSFADFWYKGHYWVREVDTNIDETGKFEQTLTLMPYYIGIDDEMGAGK